MAFLDGKVWNLNRQGQYYVTVGASDLPTTADFFNVGDWVVNINPTIALGDPSLWQVTSISGTTPTFGVIAYANPRAEVTLTTSTTLTTAYRNVLANATSAGFTLTLPTIGTASAQGAAGFGITIIKSDSSTNPVTVAAASGNTIIGQASQILNTQFQIFDAQADGNVTWDKLFDTPYSLREVGAPVTLTSSDRIAIITTAGTVTLPAATAWPVGVAVNILSQVGNTTLTPAGGTINGAASATLAAYGFALVTGDGTNYYMTGKQTAPYLAEGSSTVTLTTANQIYIGATAGTITLPAATAWPVGQVILLHHVGVDTITPVSGNINGATSVTTTTHSGNQYTSDGTNWYQVG